MADTNDTRYKTGNPICDAVRFLKDASYAILPADAARQLGEFEKNVWGSIRWFAEKNVNWIDESLAAAERLREEWRRRCEHTTGPEPITQTPPPEGVG